MSSNYPNHYEMKKNRLKVLKEKDWLCDICGGKAQEVHHADEDRSNHEPSNLVPVCRSCHIELHTIHLDKPAWNIHEIEFQMMKRGLDAKSLAKKIGMTYAAVSYILRNGQSKNSTMKKIADAFELPVEHFIIYGKVS